MFQYSELVIHQTYKDMAKGMLERNVTENILRQCIPVSDEEYRQIREELEWKRKDKASYQLALLNYSMLSLRQNLSKAGKVLPFLR